MYLNAIIMENSRVQNNFFDELGVRLDSFEDLDVILNIKQLNEASPRPDNKLDEVIKKELDFLEGQLTKINHKLKTNYDSLLLKQSENEEMRKIIDFYSLNTDTRSPKSSSCGCTSTCSIH